MEIVMNNISGGSYASYVAGYAYTASGLNKTEKKETANQNTANAVKNDTSAYGVSGKKEVSGKREVSGQTIGNPKLSEKASKYYDELKKKYANMNFILVSEDMKEQAKANAAGYANANKMVVLIDEDKIERMAEDENYRKQYEAIIANAASGMSQLGSSIAATGASVKGYGMQVNDNGTATYFAVLEKSSAAQKERIEKKAAKKKAEEKAKDKKAQKEAEKERIKKSHDKAEKISDKEVDTVDIEDADGKINSASDTVIITASSIEELLSKIQNESQKYLSDNILSEKEKNIIEVKAKKLNMTITKFIISSCLKDKIVIVNELDKVGTELRRIGNNINQLTRLANEKIITVIDLKELRMEVNNVWQLLKQLVQKQT